MYPWGDNRRFHSYACYMKKYFGGRVQKLTIDAGFTCPNRDGTVGIGGCTFCNNESFNPSYCNPGKPISQQLSEGIEFHAFRYRRAKKFMAYFQAYSNTYAPLNRLKELYEQALSYPNVIGIVIGTRPDCIDEVKLDYLASLAKSHYVLVEYGVESTSNKTLASVNRGHTFEQSVWAIEQTAKRGINVGAHFIIGLPGESEDQIIEQTHTINTLPLTSIKFHQLQIIRNTAMSVEYASNPGLFRLFSIDEYLELLLKIVERLNPRIVIERFTSETPPANLIAPVWGSLRADQVLVRFEKLLEAKDTWQGRKWNIQ
ncbi:MAG: TIGR01212 family radical SAM protein [Tenuifilaceae bacterium]|nr:TIGR01212 family radical SAM protein [Bacteroidales bacterium]MDI9516877.1 TIGR01212 family radical SAM protein [Bacteroidota bacterium]NLH55412.1 TIGR01212 family radical SAM protein [Rikenellaceae bacterium]OQC64623.1 MAG: Oxygen-independent coproporphyrinogen-III oxidase 2 [Bacteroidetes bacterium ADurb.Bin008]HNV80960.1 TIGR01212 family radical SAM protein [Tenuifilaceae bacterium]